MKHPKTLVTSAILLCLAVVALAEEPTTAITVYNQGMALVRQKRTLDLEKGVQEFSYDGVASQIDPTSVLLKGKGLKILEQNYEYDLVDNTALMSKYIGEQIEIQLVEQGGLVRGRLLSAGPPVIVEEKDGRIRSITHASITSIDFPALPDGLMLKPTLRWLLVANKAGKMEADLSYITRGISWNASYVAVISANDDAIDLAGWVQMDNRSGATYENARLKLMAGDVQVLQQVRGRKAGGYMEANTVDFFALDEGFAEKEFFEYHLYTLPRPVTIKHNQQKQISLFEPASTPAKKVFTYDNRVDQTKITVSMEFTNSEENGLGLPLPKGLVRLMKRDSDGNLEFIGEDNIDHTPRDEDIQLVTGKAFDLVAERVVTNEVRRGNVYEYEVELSLRNHKKEAVTIVVVEHNYANWSIENESIKGRKTDSRTYKWNVPVPADGEIMLKYRVKAW